MLPVFFPAHAQFAVVADRDGYANIREGSDGAGGYLALWTFDRNRFTRRYIYGGF